MRTARISLFVVVLVAAGSFALALSQGYTVIVTDGETGHPIEGAVVTLKGEPGTYSGTTDEKGEVIFDLPYGDYSLTVSADGYTPSSETVSIPVAEPDRRRNIPMW
jgi:hypothetical protein